MRDQRRDALSQISENVPAESSYSPRYSLKMALVQSAPFLTSKRWTIESSTAAPLARFRGDPLDDLPARPGEDKPLKTASGRRMIDGKLLNFDRANLILHGCSGDFGERPD